MSEFTDDTLDRYLDQQPEMREALLYDPAQHMQAEVLRQTLAMVERAMTDESVPDDVRRRVINRAVWGEPEGLVDFHAKVRETREEILSAFDLPKELTDAWTANHPEHASPVSSEET